MDLIHGGHLSHGSPANRSGKLYHAIHYTIDPQTERIDYEAIQALAEENKPKILIAGFSSYPWSVNWRRLRSIADASGAYLMADIAHVAGLVAGGVYPSPVGFAHITTFTTHKSLCGPRGACILTQEAALSRKIDRAVFPGEQGGPHVHVFAAMALAFKLAHTAAFQQSQKQVVRNAEALASRLMARGFRIPYGGTDTHMLLLDCASHRGASDVPLSGEMASRILDLAGIVVNRNTIPGDTSASNPSGIRLGTVWATQRGCKENDMIRIADFIADLLLASKPYIQPGRKDNLLKTKMDFDVMERTKCQVRDFMARLSCVESVPHHGYPHFYYIDDMAGETGEKNFLLKGENVRSFINFIFDSDAEELDPGECQETTLHTSLGEVNGILTCQDVYGYLFTVPAEKAGLAASWLRDLSDGYVDFDLDVLRRMPGPIIVSERKHAPKGIIQESSSGGKKPYVVLAPEQKFTPLPLFHWTETQAEIRKTPIHAFHLQLGAKMIPFAGWEMPVWYSSVMEEHLAVRQSAGLFDVAHMGVYQAEGPDACVFLDSVVGNDIVALEVGESCYTHFMDPEANVIDDLLIYRRGFEKYLVVVNASNDDKDWAWLNAVKEGTVQVDRIRPWARAFGRNVILRNLRDPQAGNDMRVDIALQGPRSKDILLSLGCDAETRQRILSLRRTHLCEAILGGGEKTNQRYDIVVSRTGYTGERMAFELFIHPQHAEAFCKDLVAVGEPFGLKPCGLGARDSLRTEAGLPLYGHEMGGDLNLNVSEAGYGSYVKVYKPWFIGREAYISRDHSRKGEIVRFRFLEKGVRMAHLHDPVLDKRGRMIGVVTSCAVDRDGYLTGQAFVELKNTDEGIPILIYQSAPKEGLKAPADLKTGERYAIPTPAVVTSRFL
jgi:glycine hydroxymethyltransferase